MWQWTTKKRLPLAAGVLLAALTLADLLNPAQGFSQMENRYLAQRPAWTLSRILSGEYARAYELYVDDQFLWRENWMEAKAWTEALLGRTENNGVVFGLDGWLFKKRITLTELYEKNLEAVRRFAIHAGGLPVSFLLAPSSDAVLTDKVPEGLYNLDQAALIAKAYDRLSLAGIAGLDVLTALRQSQEPYLYYRTDHHWTTQGAYTAYLAWCGARGITPVQPDPHGAHVVKEFSGTLAAAAKRQQNLLDEILYYDMPHASLWLDGVRQESLYDLSRTEGRDKYGLFLHNNPGRLTLTSTHPQAEEKTLLVFKDSYANAFLPFLTAHVRTIEVVDVRQYNGRVSELLAQGDWDEVLLLYHVDSLLEERSMLKLGY